TYTGKDAFVFPVGDSTIWARNQISAPSVVNTVSSWSCQYFYATPTGTGNFNTPLVRVSIVEYWQLDRTVGSGNVRVSLYFEDSARSGIINAANLRVAKFDGSNWIDMAFHNGTIVNGKGYTTSSYISSFSPFTFGSINHQNYLPVEFLTVDAKWSNNDGVVSWQTGSEENNSHFIIERSFDGSEFAPIGTMPSKKLTSQSILNYSFTDINVSNQMREIVYYRIKQVDYDGQSKFSSMVYLEKEISNQLNVFPNPSNGKLTIESSMGLSQISITDLSGTQLINQTISNLQNTCNLNLEHLAKGVYILVLQTNKGVVTKKIVHK
ncbi:MAG: T9SS type A sorting domain-containing protein, partial [Bacteroidia bacterium]|nr:T9SS type A sorting domain-containing protein [Bacteroidia bacterium]